MRRPSVANAIRAEQRRETAALSADERVALALELGARALADYCHAHGVEPAEARRRLARHRQARRRASARREALLE